MKIIKGSNLELILIELWECEKIKERKKGRDEEEWNRWQVRWHYYNVWYRERKKTMILWVLVYVFYYYAEIRE